MYNRNRGAGDVYSRGTAELVKDRDELFSGYDPAKSPGSGRFFDGPDVKDNEAGDDDDVEGIKQQTRYVKQESVNSTRNALRLAREAEEVGQNTLNRLGGQSEKLRQTELHLVAANVHAGKAKLNTNELKHLNQSIFRPTFLNSRRKGGNEVDTLDSNESYDDMMKRDPDDDNRINRDSLVGGSSKTNQRSKEQRKRYQFDANASDDEIEDELDNNLDEISQVTSNLNALSMAMGKELNRQNGYINVIDEKTGRLDNRILSNTERLKKIK
jgi:hypothetical protein